MITAIKFQTMKEERKNDGNNNESDKQNDRLEKVPEKVIVDHLSFPVGVQCWRRAFDAL